MIRAFVDHGVETPWSHQVAAADLAHAGQHVVISTGTASGEGLVLRADAQGQPAVLGRIVVA